LRFFQRKVSSKVPFDDKGELKQAPKFQILLERKFPGSNKGKLVMSLQKKLIGRKLIKEIPEHLIILSLRRANL